MFCPACRDEFRPGFTHCAACGVELVETLDPNSQPAPPPSAARAPRHAAGPVSMIEYCGFVSLEEARGARDRLRHDGIRSDIVIRDGPEPHERAGGPAEEYWLRVERDRFAQATALLGFDEATHEADDSTFQCGECGAEVAAEESFCPKCGSRFEEA